MPRGPKGEKRPADTNQRAVMIGRIATGEIEDAVPSAEIRRQKPGCRRFRAHGREGAGRFALGRKTEENCSERG